MASPEDLRVIALARAGNPSELYKRILDIFGHRGVTVGQAGESPQARVMRIAQEVLGGRDLDNVRDSVQGIATRTAATAAATPAASTPTPVNPATVEQQSGRGQIATILAQLGFAPAAAKRLGDWAWAQIQNGMSFQETLVQLYQQPDFRAEFPELEARRNAGLVPISPAEIVEYRRGAAQLMRSAGLAPGFFDSKKDFTNLIVNDVSLTELDKRIAQGFRRVNEAGPEIRAAFGDIYGAQGDAALAMYFLDPEKSMPLLEQAADVGYFVGTGRRFGYNLGVSNATKMSALDVTDEQARSGFDSLHQLDVGGGVFQETIDENQDLTVEDQGVEAVFGTGGTGAQDIKKRQDTRSAAFQGGGGAGLSQGGLGLGSNRR